MKPKRPWLVTGKSNEFEWNGTVGSRFATLERAEKFATKMREEGWWNVRVVYDTVLERGAVYVL